MSVIARIKKFLEEDSEERYEVYRSEFEKIKRADNPSVNLSKVGAEYVEQDIQKHWLEWSTEQGLINAAM